MPIPLTPTLQLPQGAIITPQQQRGISLAEAAQATIIISPEHRRLKAIDINQWTLADWILNESLGPGKPTSTQPDQRIVPLKTKIFGGSGAPVKAYCPFPIGGVTLTVSDARARIMVKVQQEYGTVTLARGTLIFHSNEYLGEDLLACEPCGGQMTMPFVKRYGKEESTQSRRIFCNLAMTPTLKVAGNITLSVSMYIVTREITLIRLPYIRDAGYMKDLLGFSEASTFKDYTSAVNVDGMYMITSIDVTDLANTAEADLGWTLRPGEKAFPEVALFSGHEKMIKIGQIDLIPTIPGKTCGMLRNELITETRPIFAAAEAAKKLDATQPDAKPVAIGEINRKLRLNISPGQDGRRNWSNHLTQLVNMAVPLITTRWGAVQNFENTNLTITPQPTGCWMVPSTTLDAIIKNKVYIIQTLKDRDPAPDLPEEEDEYGGGRRRRTPRRRSRRSTPHQSR